MKIKQIMSQPAVTCCESDNLNTAAQRMWDHDIGAVLVVDDSDQVVGIVTDRDICMAAYTQGKDLSSIPISGSMATTVYSCNASDTLEGAEALMREKQVRRVPVLDGDNRVAGVVSLNDIARHVHTSKQDGVMSRGVVDTLSAICAPRGHALVARPPMAMQQT
jgi:CBS domain-containing protein